jgi:hypothetical protein
MTLIPVALNQKPAPQLLAIQSEGADKWLPTGKGIRAAWASLIGNNGLWIAADAKKVGLMVSTDNERELQRMDGYQIEKWTQGERSTPIKKASVCGLTCGSGKTETYERAVPLPPTRTKVTASP